MCYLFYNLRATLLSKINLNNNFDESQSEETSSIFKKLMNPRNIDETKHICNFIQSSFLFVSEYFILWFMSLYVFFPGLNILTLYVEELIFYRFSNKQS